MQFCIYDYLKNKIKPEKISFLSKNLSHKERAQEVESWLISNEIDFVVAQICPSTLYALSSNCVPVIANLSQDCYTFTLGPGFGDISYLVTLDQIFKYKFKKTSHKHYSKIIMLPLHSDDQLNYTDKMDLTDLNNFNTLNEVFSSLGSIFEGLSSLQTMNDVIAASFIPHQVFEDLNFQDRSWKCSLGPSARS